VQAPLKADARPNRRVRSGEPQLIDDGRSGAQNLTIRQSRSTPLPTHPSPDTSAAAATRRAAPGDIGKGPSFRSLSFFRSMTAPVWSRGRRVEYSRTPIRASLEALEDREIQPVWVGFEVSGIAPRARDSGER